MPRHESRKATGRDKTPRYHSSSERTRSSSEASLSQTRRKHKQQRRSSSYDRRERHRSRRRVSKPRSYHKRRYSSSSSVGEGFQSENRRSKQTKHQESSSRTFERILNAFKDIQNISSGNQEKFPVLNNVIPEFDPMSKEQSIEVWIHKVEECAQIYNWDEKHIVHYALPKLAGLAKTWYQGLPSLLHSWSEWKAKLKESFPSRSNYAELLSEMLNKRVKFGESFELYYYAKMNLLYRCEISGKRAVDCLIFGIEDRSVRLGAQAAEFTEPEQLLKFFKSVKAGYTSTELTNNNKDRDKRGRQVTTSSSSSANKERTVPEYTCYNCKEKGHRSFQCTKPVIRCDKCKMLGHVIANCPKINHNNNKESSVTKNILLIESIGNTSVKYKMPMKINNEILNGYVDLGSEGTLIRFSDAQRIKLNWGPVDGMYLLKGFGSAPYCPIGISLATIEIQGIKETDVEILVVDDNLLNAPILIGHTFTERPTIKIIKTDSDVIFQRSTESNATRCPLKCMEKIFIESGEGRIVPIYAELDYTGKVYVQGTIRGRPGSEYYLFPGEYILNQGKGQVIIQNIGSGPCQFGKDDLITRSYIISQHICINRVEAEFSSPDNQALKCGDSLTLEQKNALRAVIDRHSNCFSSGLQDLGYCRETEMVIQVTDSQPVVYRPYRLPYADRQLVKEMINEMLESSIIRESHSPYASPIVLVNKKSGEKRLCVDYRALNRKTVKEHYPMPRIEDQLDLLSGSSIFTTLDLSSGYYQIPIEEKSREKTSFVTPDGQYEYCRMPFGLVNAPSVFQRTLNKIIQKSPARAYVLVYMDDILIPAKNFDEALTRLNEVLGILRNSGLTLKLSKCHFCFNKIDYLGYEVSAEGVRPGSLKTDAISKFPTPKNVHEVRRFIGLASFFRRFVQGFAVLACPLTTLLKKNCPWKWGKDEEKAFRALQERLVERPVLAIYNPTSETQLHTDACKTGVAGILLQKDESGSFKPIAYYSRQTSIDEQKLHSYELETLAVIASLCKFRVYLLGIKFTIVTDCNALRTTLTKRDLIPRIARWWIQFQEFDCEIEYRSGEKMAHVDALSRAAVDNEQNEQRVLDILNINVEDWLVTVQQSDDEIKRITSILSNPKTEEHAEIFKNYRLKNGRVYRIIDTETERWLVPKSARWHILKSNHDAVGHFGFDKTLARIKSLFWFPRMRRFVKKYVTACLECAHHKLPGGSVTSVLQPIPKVNIPFHTVHADHLGPFIRSKHGNVYILVMVDAFTKFVIIKAVRNTKSATSIKVFREVISYFGAPSRLVTDQGSSFTSREFKEFVQKSGIKHIYNAVATPRANGQVERYNRTILAALGAMNHDRPNGAWDEHLPQIQLGLNTTVHSITKKSPTELLFGRQAPNPALGVLKEVIDDIATDTVESHLESARASASLMITKQQEKDKERNEKKILRKHRFVEGQLVRLIKAKSGIEGQSKKLEPKCQGPFRIKKVLPNDRFVVEDTPITRKGRRYEAVVAIDKIFPWHVNQNLNSSDSEGSDDNGSGEE